MIKFSSYYALAYIFTLIPSSTREPTNRKQMLWQMPCFASYWLQPWLTTIFQNDKCFTNGAFPPFGLTSVMLKPASLKTWYGWAISGKYHPVFFPVFPMSSWLVRTINIATIFLLLCWSDLLELQLKLWRCSKRKWVKESTTSTSELWVMSQPWVNHESRVNL